MKDMISLRKLMFNPFAPSFTGHALSSLSFRSLDILRKQKFKTVFRVKSDPSVSTFTVLSSRLPSLFAFLVSICFVGGGGGGGGERGVS